MRASFLAFVFAAVSAVHADDAAPADRNVAYERVRDSERLVRLVDRVGEEIKHDRAEAALAAASEAVDLAPDNPAALNAKAAALIELGRYEEAAPLLNAALREDPDHMEALYNRAEALFMQGKYSDAAVEFRLLFGKFPANALIKFKLYLSYHFGGREDLAENALQTLRFPFDGAAWYYSQAANKLLDGDRKAAKKLIRAAEAIHPEDAASFHETLVRVGLLK